MSEQLSASDVSGGYYPSQLPEVISNDHLCIPVSESDPAIQELLHKIGFSRHAMMSASEGTAGISYRIERVTIYNTALHTIGLEEMSGTLPQGSYADAARLLFQDRFDESELGMRYLPQQHG